MLKRAEIVDKLINEGFKHETLSSFSDLEITMLGTKLIAELKQSDIMMQQAQLQRKQEICQEAYDGCLGAVAKGQKKVQNSAKSVSTGGGGEGGPNESVEDYNREDDGTKTIDTDNIGNPDVDIKKGNGSKEDVKLITDKDETEEEITQEMIEDWMGGVITREQKGLTKSKLIEIVKNIKEDDIGGMTSDPELMRREYGDRKNKKHAPGRIGYGDNPKPRTKLFSSVEQEYAFEQLNKYVLELDGYEIKVDELESGEDPEEDILNLFLESDSGIVWDIIIYTDGNIYMDGAPIQDSQDLEEEIREKESGGEGDDRPDNWRELPGYNPDYFYGDDDLFDATEGDGDLFDDEEDADLSFADKYKKHHDLEKWLNVREEKELAETERDTEGVYMGAPVGTEMPAPTPVITPTTTPTRPTRRRGPFERPKVKPNPKAGKDKMPEWMGFDDIKSQTENS